MSDRLTAAGEALLEGFGRYTETREAWRQAFAVIEAEAAARAVGEALSVERMAEALCGTDELLGLHANPCELHREQAAALVVHLRGPR